VTRQSSIRVLAHGSFGHAVGGYLDALSGPDRCDIRAVRLPFSRGLHSFLAEGMLGVLATHRDLSADLEAFAATAEAVRLTWLAVALSPGHVRVGPLIIPGAAPCQACYSARSAQHGRLSTGLEQAFEQDDDLGIDGFPPHIAAMAAGLALALARPTAVPGGTGPGSTAPRGDVYMIDMASDAVSSGSVIPVHGCQTCEPGPQSGRMLPAGVDRLRALARRICPPPEHQEMRAS